MAFVLTPAGAEKGRVAAFNAIFKRVDILDASATVLATANIPADTEDGDQEAANKAAITLTPSVSGTAATVKTYDTINSGGTETGTAPAADVLNSTNIVSGEAITIPIGALGLSAA